MSDAINNKTNLSETAGESEGQETVPIYYILYDDHGLWPCNDTPIDHRKVKNSCNGRNTFTNAQHIFLQYDAYISLRNVVQQKRQLKCSVTKKVIDMSDIDMPNVFFFFNLS